MKAFLLAAGKGTRLRPYTDTRPKCLIPIHGTPLLGIWLDLLARHSVDEVLINTHHHADQVRRYVEDQRKCTALALHLAHEPSLLGSAGTLWRNRSFVDGQADFIIAYADNLTNLDLGKMIDFHGVFRSMGGVLTMGLMHAPDPTQCGVAVLDDTRRIVRFEEKPVRPVSDLANCGIYIAAGTLFDYFDAGAAENADAVYDMAFDVLPKLTGKMYGVPIEGYLRDIGTPESYRRALDEWPGREKTDGF